MTRCCVWPTTYSCKGIGCGVLSTGRAPMTGCAVWMGPAGELRDQVGEGHEVTRCVDAEVRCCRGLDVAE